MTIACLSSETAYDVQCPVCGRGFLFLTDPTEAVDSGALRRVAGAALASQHNRLKSQMDRRNKSRDRRIGLPDLRALKVERRQSDRRGMQRDRREGRPEQLGTEQERRTAAATFRRGSGAVHPKDIFYLQGWDGESASKAGVWTNGAILQHAARC